MQLIYINLQKKHHILGSKGQKLIFQKKLLNRIITLRTRLILMGLVFLQVQVLKMGLLLLMILSLLRKGLRVIEACQLGSRIT